MLHSDIQDFMDPVPGPIDPTVLYLQNLHRSEDALAGDKSVLRVRRLDTLLHDHVALDQRLVPYLRRAGLYSFRRVGFMQIDQALITALVERWRQETHTFHLPVGECTITLQDVEVLLGLPVDGRPVICSTAGIFWEEVCERLLGKVPPPSKREGGRIRFKWLLDEFAVIPPGADDVILEQYARAYIFMLLNGSLFSDTSGKYVYLSVLLLLEDIDAISTYSWGSAALAWLYNHMCSASKKRATQISGCTILLQYWTYEHISFIAPGIRSVPTDHDWHILPLSYRWSQGELKRSESSSHCLKVFRFQLDSMTEEHMIWSPYTEDILARLPVNCHRGRHIWRAKVPLIFFNVIELHAPDRVLRQFGLVQDIPEAIHTDINLHESSFASKTNWNIMYRQYIQIWDDRINRIVSGGDCDLQTYIEWYRGITRKFVSRKCLIADYMMESMRHIYDVAGEHSCPSYTHGSHIQSVCNSMFRNYHEYALGTREDILPMVPSPAAYHDDAAAGIQPDDVWEQHVHDEESATTEWANWDVSAYQMYDPTAHRHSTYEHRPSLQYGEYAHRHSTYEQGPSSQYGDYGQGSSQFNEAASTVDHGDLTQEVFHQQLAEAPEPTELQNEEERRGGFMDIFRRRSKRTRRPKQQVYRT